MADTTHELRGALEHWKSGRRDHARGILKRLITRDPRHPGVNQLYAMTLADQGQFEQAVYYMGRAIAAEPTFAEFQMGLGIIKSNTPDWQGALAAFRKATEIDPKHAGALAAMGLILCDKGRVDEAEGVLRRALDLEPKRLDASLAMARVLLETFRVEEALTMVRGACAAHPQDRDALSLLCFMQNYAWDMTPEQTLAAPWRYAGMLPRMSPLAPGSMANTPEPDRPLRIGYLSPDLRDHSVSFFLEPILRGHDRTAFTPYCYYTGGHVDATTERLKGLCEGGRTWRHLFVTPDAQVIEAIRKDRIDILIDLAGHSSQHRLPLFTQRPAPVQASYIGYAATTGLPEIDYRIVDAVTDPPGFERFAAERQERLDGCFLCYQPPKDAPEPRAAAAGGVTFGSFNLISKVSDPTVELWSRLLREVPGSRLLLKSKALDRPEIRARITERFGRAGIAAEQIECLGRLENAADHLNAYSRLDIALDPFPYNGTTTTCEALWMGVPTVTLMGDRHIARVGASLLTAAGLKDLVASTQDEYIRIASALARDQTRRAELRRGLRTQIAQSRLCDAAAHSRTIQDAYRRMWRRWCDSGPGSRAPQGSGPA